MSTTANSSISPAIESRNSLADLVAARAAERPDAIAVEDGDVRLSYGELDAAVTNVAAGLRAAGVGDQEAVGVCLPRSWQAICALLGILRAGGAYVPVSPAYPAKRQRALLDLAGARFALSGREHDRGLPSRVRRLDLETLAGTPTSSDMPAAPGGDRIAYVLFTSGSTGSPKGVEVTHGNVVHLLRSDDDIVPRRDDVVLQVVPLEFDVSGMEIWGALLNGARLVIAPRGRLDPGALGTLIAERSVSYLGLSTGVLHELIRAALQDLGGLRLAVPLGDVLSPRLAAELRAAHPHVRVLNAYGPTETTIACSTYELPAVVDEPVPIGRALPGYRFHVLDQNQAPVADGETGELWIGGAGVARGYRGDPERTAAAFREDPFDGGTMYRSGDRVRMREDGELLFLGRFDDQVKIAGQRVEPAEVEVALSGHPELRQAAVIAREDVPGHKRLVGYAVPRPGAQPAPPDLRAHLAELLPSFMVPDTIELLAALPLNERGKVDRSALPAPGRSGTGDVASDPRVASVAETMAEVLRLETVGPEENFFELGGTSLLAIRLIGRLRLRLGSEIEIGAIFDAPTAAALAERLGRESDSSRALPPLRPGRRETTAPVSAAQRRAWLFGRLNPDSIAYQFAAIFRFGGGLDEAALEGAMADLLGRHEILRTHFEERAGEPIQAIADAVSLPLERIDLRGEESDVRARIERERVRTRIDPGVAPLLRWTLLRLDDRRWDLIQVEHHLIHDGWSFAVLAGELAELYSARAEGRPATLPAVEIQFQDYSRWEQRVHGSKAVARQLEHWKRVLEPNPPLLELPADQPRPARESFAGSSIRRRLEPELAGRLRGLAQSEGATLFMVTLAAFYAQLRHYTGNADLQVGSGLANRRDQRSEGLIGMALNTVALRCDLGGDPTVRELLDRVRAVALDAYANADAPFDTVVEALRPQRDPRRSPLIQTLFSFHDAPRARGGWAGLETDLVQIVPNGSAKADLNVIGIDDGDGGLTFVWEHSDLFTDASAERFAGHHLELLARFAATPEARLSELDLTTAEERDQLSAWSLGEGEYEYDRSATVPELVRRQVDRDPDAPAVVGPGDRLTYAELLDRARVLAGSLRDAGVEPGDRVGVLLPRSSDSVAAFLGVLVAGAAYVPLDPQHPSGRIARALADAGAVVVLTDAKHSPELPAAVGAIDLATATGEPGAAANADPQDLAYMMYTSGSTGEPKGVEVTHRNVGRLVDDPDYVELGPGTVMLHAASTAFDAATLELWGPLANGGTIAVLPEHPSPDAIAAAIQTHGVTTLWLTAGLFHELVDRRPDCLEGVRHLLAGGDVLSPPHVARALAALPPEGRLTNGYGPTETTTFALTHELRPGDAVSDPVPLGRPIQGTSCEVLDASERAVPVGVAGELWIGGDGVARGYRNDPELTAARFQDDPARPGGRRYRSGDRARRRPDGTLEFLGRADRQLKVRGIRVEPAEVEATLRAHPDLADVAVATSESTPGGLSLTAYVVTRPGSPVPTAATLRAHATTRLPAAMVPAAWVTLSRLPLTANGKVDRSRLPAPGREHLAAAGSGRRPRGRTERRVAKAFEGVLGVRSVAAEDDFFALGGHSLLAVELFGRLERIGGRRLPLATIFEAPTPRALAACLDADASATQWDNLVALKPQGSKPPLFIVGAGDGNIVGFGQLARELSAEQPLYVLQPSGLDGRHPLDQGIGTMAERYLEKVRSVRPRGPYLLAGRCNGATVAYEMAQRLRAAGEEVPLLVALDSDPPPAGPRELAPGIPYDAIMESAWVRARASGEDVPDLDAPNGLAELAAWLRAPVGPGVSRYLLELHSWRPDLQTGWPDPCGADGPELAAWAWDHGVHDSRLSPRLLLPAPTDGCRPPGHYAWDAAMATIWEELGREPADPVSPVGWTEFCARLTEPLDGTRMNRYLLSAWPRPDLKAAFPEPRGVDAEGMIEWAWTAGIDDGLAPAFLPPLVTRLPRRRQLELLTQTARTACSRASARALRGGREAATAARVHAVNAVERRLKRPLPGARERTERDVVAAARTARATYRAEPWPGRVVLVTSPEFAEKPAYAAWALRAEEGVDRRPLPVGHVEMLRGTGARLLAACLEECAEKSLGDRAS